MRSFRVRDDLAQSYNPVNALECMLITQMAQSWLRLQRACAAEERYFKTHDVLEAIAGEFEQYKAVTRQVTDCERAWRHAMLHLEKTQRRRQQSDRSSPNARRRPLPERVPETSAATPANPPDPAPRSGLVPDRNPGATPSPPKPGASAANAG
jgi:hypothetical protein